MTDYFKKYLKYKQKYIELKNLILNDGGVKPEERKRKRKQEEEEEEEKKLALLLQEFEEEHATEPPAKQVNRGFGTEIKGDIPHHGIFTIHVNHIKFTQQTISHSFSKDGFLSEHTISSNIEKLIEQYIKNHIKLNINDIQRILNLSEGDKYLQCIKYKEQIYSCNNRRLCMYKTLFKRGIFDGNVLVTFIKDCHHKYECLNENCDDVHITYDDRPGRKCSEL